MNPYSSIIIPVYNVAPYLRECLDSVLAQTFTDWEALCIDDGSTDESGSILDEYAAKDSRFRVIHQANAGVSAARNRGLDVALGEWVCLLDSDDLVGCDWLQAIHVAATAGKDWGPDWIKTGCTWWWPEKQENPDLSCRVESNCPVCQYESTELLKRVAGQGMPFLHAWRRERLGDVRFSLKRCVPCDDEVFMLSAFAQTSRACSINYSAGYFYRIRASSLAHSRISPQNAVNYLDEILELSKCRPGVFAPDALSRIVNASFCSIWCNGLGKDRLLDRDVRNRILRLRKMGFLAIRHVPRVVDKMKWICFMLFGFWPKKLF